MPLYNFRVNPLYQNFNIVIGNDEADVHQVRFENEMRAGENAQRVNEIFRVATNNNVRTTIPEIGFILASSMQRIVNVLFQTTGIGYSQYLIILHQMYYDDELNDGPSMTTRRIYNYLPHADLIDVIYITGFSNPITPYGQVAIINPLAKQSY